MEIDKGESTQGRVEPGNGSKNDTWSSGSMGSVGWSIVVVWDVDRRCRLRRSRPIRSGGSWEFKFIDQARKLAPAYVRPCVHDDETSIASFARFLYLAAVPTAPEPPPPPKPQPHQILKRLKLPHVPPQLEGPVVRRRDEARAAGEEIHAHHAPLVALEGLEQAEVARAPHLGLDWVGGGWLVYLFIYFLKFK